jgi:GT2 family glycosyltransferase
MSSENIPFVIVLILSYNGKHLLEDSISSYLTNDYPNFEVVVIDNGSNDRTNEWVDHNHPGVSVLRTDKNLGYSGGFNFGLDYAFNKKNADYVLITNNDVKADFKIISELVKVAESDPMIGFVTGKVYYYDQPATLQTVGKYEDPVRWNGEHIGKKEIDKGQYDQVAERIFADDIFTLVSRKLYLDTGGYDTTFRFQAEEYDWQARGKKLGYKIYYTPYAKIWHKDSMTIGKRSAFKAYYDARNPMLVILKHKSPEFFRKYFWQHFKNGIIRSSLVSLKQLRPKVSFAIWRGFVSGLIWGFKNKQFSVRHFIMTEK